MESFLYSEINQASRTKDITKIKYYGAFAAALSYIIFSANKKRTDGMRLTNTVLYRGLRMDINTVRNNFQENSIINLLGYTSTSKNFGKALSFALEDDSPDKVPVVFIIYFRKKSGLIELTSQFSAYPNEEEVLV